MELKVVIAGGGTGGHLFPGIAVAQEFQSSLAAHLVLGMGGYASGPVGVAAYLSKIPLVLHEQNVIPGVANRWLAKVADRVFLSFPDTFSYFPRDLGVGTS